MRSDDIHPIHLQRLLFELTKVAGKPTSGVMKDVVTLGGYQQMEIVVVADNPGLRLFEILGLSRFESLPRRADRSSADRIAALPAVRRASRRAYDKLLLELGRDVVSEYLERKVAFR